MVITGDCRDLLKCYDDNSFNYCFTSPPYNRLRNDKYEKYCDKIDDYYDFLCEITDELLRVCSDAVVINIQKTSYNMADVYKWIGKYYKWIKQEFIWVKSNPMPASGKNVTNSYESFFYLSKKPPKSNYTYTKNVITTSVNSKMPKEHKAVMKQEVCDYFIGNFFFPGSTVIDPFAGLGTTEISCNKFNMECTSIELIEEYAEMARERIEKEKDACLL